ncbi:MAG TPA: 8-amino-7-oxononanoate synthase [Candidatus Obscuribacterales bacterium]
MTGVLAPLKNSLATLIDNHQLRTLKRAVPLPDGEIEVEGRRLVNFASNDYLGLAQHPFVKRLAAHYLDAYGAGSTSSRLLAGNVALYERIEESIAKFKRTEAALIFSSGFQANATIIATLAQKDVMIASDRANHSSIAHGLRLAGGRWFRYQHNNSHDLEARLRERAAHGAPCWIVTESIFSMDGDEIDFAALKSVATRYGASLYIDEAHSIGLRGPSGFGIRSDGTGNDVFLGTFGKACGSFGAFIACSHVIRDYLVNKCPGLIYSTALPPPVLGAIQAAVEIIPTMESSRLNLMERSEWLRTQLRALGFELQNSSTHIIPIVVGTNSRALHLAAFLEANGIFAPAVRTPTVPEGQARVRISLTANHSLEQIERLVGVLKKYRCEAVL